MPQHPERLERAKKLIPQGLNECIDCGKIKPLSEFYVRPEFANGYPPRCKDCSIILESQRRERRRSIRKNIPLSKECTNCHKVKQSNQFGFDASRLNGLACWCKECSVKSTRILRRKIMPETIKSKACSRCYKVKPSIEFRISQTSKSGLCSWCISCEKDYRKEFAGKFPDQRKMAHRVTRYGITNDEFNAMIESQNGVCAICGKPETRTVKGKLTPLSIDHDHAQGVGVHSVRGLLCNECNSGLGRFHDSPDLLIRAADYLRKFVKV
jgi:hypothetical protein